MRCSKSYYQMVLLVLMLYGSLCENFEVGFYDCLLSLGRLLNESFEELVAFQVSKSF